MWGVSVRAVRGATSSSESGISSSRSPPEASGPGHTALCGGLFVLGSCYHVSFEKDFKVEKK